LSVTIKHSTSVRVRFKFPRSLKRQEFNLLHSTFSLYFHDLHFFPSSSRSGCVVVSQSGQLISPDLLLEFLNKFFEGPFPLGPSCPPTRFESFCLQGIQVGIKTSLTLAVLGWVLPILPGTPFFLVAWLLGWRPSSDSSKEGKN